MTQLLDNIRTELVAGAERMIQRRRVRRRIAVGAMTLLAASAVVTVGFGVIGTDPAFAVSEGGDGTIHVDIYPQFDQAEALRAELADAGVVVEVIVLRAHPSLDGVVEFVSHEQQAIGAVQLSGGELIIDPLALAGPIEMLVYSTPDPNTELRGWEPLWQAAPSVFHPDEPLGGLNCSIDGPLTSDALETRAVAEGITEIRWIFVDGPESTSDRPDGVILAASMWAPGQLTAVVSPTGPDATQLSMDDGLHFSTRPTCSSELADSWRDR